MPRRTCASASCRSGVPMVPGQSAPRRSSLVRADRVGQRPDALELELDDIARPDPAVELEAAAAGQRAPGEHVTRAERLAARGERHEVAEGERRAGGGGLAPRRAVDADGAAQAQRAAEQL